MSVIKIELDNVSRRNKELYRLFRQLDIANHELSSVSARIDNRIASRKHIEERLRDSRTRLARLGVRLVNLEQFVRDSAEQYRLADLTARRPQEQTSSNASFWDGLGGLGKGIGHAFEDAWDKVEDIGADIADTANNIGDEIADAASTSWNSFLEIGQDLYDKAQDRANHAFDSPYDLLNYLLVGIPGSLKQTLEGAQDRADRMNDSTYDFFNWLSNGTLDTLNDAFNPDEPLSKEHWLASLEVALAILGGAKAKMGSDKGLGNDGSKPKGVGDDLPNRLDEDIGSLLKKSTCSTDDLVRYLKKIDSSGGTSYADDYATSGKWPEDVQIPKSPEVLNADGSITWSEVPQGGYVLDKNGKAIKDEIFPEPGEVIDRYGPPNGRYTSPVVDGKPYNYDQRSLPYVEDASKYHQYEITGDFSSLEKYVTECKDSVLKMKIEAQIERYYNGDYSKLVTHIGEIAKGFGSTGGGIQYELPLPVEWLEGLGLIREI